MKIIHFSGGRSSAYMLLRIGQEFGWGGVLVIFCNTGKETEQTLEFVHKIGLEIPIPIHWLEYTTENKRGYKVVNFATASRKGEPFAQLNAKYKSLPNVRNRSCTGKLKIEVARKFIIDNNIKPADRENYIGIRYDEPMRYFKRKDEAKNALI